MATRNREKTPAQPFQPGTLWNLVRTRSAEALRSGALQSLPTGFESVEEQGIRFLVRVLQSLERKRQAVGKPEESSSASPETANPFLPPDPELFVTGVSDTHLALLNKFNVLDHHLLVVTRDFQEQESLLTPADFQALWTCMIEYHSLGFYNGGTVAGASQRHKHLQLVPLPLAPEGLAVPMEAALAAATTRAGPATSPLLPFVHAFYRFPPDRGADPREAARVCFDAYNLLLDATGLEPVKGTPQQRQSGPYNLLVTPKWLLLAPRSREHFDHISVNALGFAGALLVRRQQEVENLRRRGPLAVLRSVGIPLPG